MPRVPVPAAGAVLALAMTAACSAGSLNTRLPAALPTAARPSAQRALAAATYPADLAARTDAPCARVPLAPGWVQRENALPGTRHWQPGRHSDVPLYLDDPSLACGDTLTIRLGGTSAHQVVVRVVRVGWYGGAGAREIWRSGTVRVPPTPRPVFRDHVVLDAGWTTSVSTAVSAGWTPGLYLAESLAGSRVTGAAGFVVRNDATPSPLVEVHSNLTWAAYSEAGGASLYHGPTRSGSHAAVVAARAYTVSMLLPTSGAGLLRLVEEDVPLAQLTDRFGLPADHVMDTDLEVRPSVLLGHAGVVLPGHAEYWTTRAMDALQVLEQRGVNLLDLGANSLYWHARVTADAAGRPRTMTVYRVLKLDPDAAARPAQATVRWQDPPLSRPSSALVGQAYAAAFVHGGLVLHEPPPWLVAGTPARNGTVLPGILLNEADGASAKDRYAPSDVQAVAEGVLRGNGDLVVSSSYASLPSGAALFDAGSTTWLCAALDHCQEAGVQGRVARILLGMTANLLRDFGTPRWGASHPSQWDVPASAKALLPYLPRAAVGTHGQPDDGVLGRIARAILRQVR